MIRAVRRPAQGTVASLQTSWMVLLMGHASISSTRDHFGVDAKDLDRMIERSHRREREKEGERERPPFDRPAG